MLDTVFSQVGAVLWLGVCALAVARGDRVERLAAGVFVVGWLASLTARSDTDVSASVWLIMGIDALILVFLLGVGWKSDRAWPIWAAAFQAISVLVHVVMLIDLRIRAIAYISANTIGSYGVLICLAVGVWQSWRASRAVWRPRT